MLVAVVVGKIAAGFGTTLVVVLVVEAIAGSGVRLSAGEVVEVAVILPGRLDAVAAEVRRFEARIAADGCS